jgi:hypothetical protein
VSIDGLGSFADVPVNFPPQSYSTPALVTAVSGAQPFIMRARSVGQPFLGGVDGSARFVGMTFDFGAAPTGAAS